MAVRLEHVQQAASTAGGTQTFTVPGLGSAAQLRMAIFWWSRGITRGLKGAHGQLGFGAAAAGGSVAVNAVARNLVTPSQAASMGLEDACILLGDGSGGLLGAARRTAWVDDGIEVEWVVTPGQGILVDCLLIADDGLDTQAAVGTGTAPVTGGEVVLETGLQDQVELVLFATTQGALGQVADGNAARTDDARLILGWAVNPRQGNGAVQQQAAGQGSEDDLAGSDSWNLVLDGYCLASGSAAGVSGQVVARDFDLDGPGTLRLASQGNAEEIPFVWAALSFNRSVPLWGGLVETPTQAGEAVQGAGPGGPASPLQAILALQTLRTATGHGSAGAAMAVGTLTEGSAGSSGAHDQNGASPAVAQSVTSLEAARLLSASGGTLLAASPPAAERFPESGGWRLDWTAVSGTPRPWPTLAFGRWAASSDRASCDARSTIDLRLRRRRRMSTTVAGSSVVGGASGGPGPWPPAPPEPPAVVEPTPADVQYVVERLPGAGTDTITDGAGNVLATDNRGLVWLAENGYLQSGDGSDVVVGIRGIVGQTTQHGINGGLGGRIDNVVHLVAMDPGAYEFNDRGDGIKVIGLGHSSGGFEAIHFWRITFYNVADSLQCIITQDNESVPDPGPYHTPSGLIGVHYCKFTGFDAAAYSWGAPAPDGLPAKWWINGKGAASWWIRGCLFPDVREHSHYLHYPQVAWIEGNQYRYTGGTCGQFVSRAGRLQGYGFLHGNPYWPPAGSLGPLVIRNNVHDDGTEIPSQSYRDGGSFTVVGWLGDVWVLNNTIRGNVAAGLVIWADTFKGMYLLPEYEGGPVGIYRGRSSNPTWNAEDTTPGPPPVHRKTHGRVYVHDFFQEYAAHNNREQVAITGAQVVELGRVFVATDRPGIMLDAEFGGPFKNGKRGFRDEYADETWQATNKIGEWRSWQGPSGQNHFWSYSEFLEHLASIDKVRVEASGGLIARLTPRGAKVRATSAISLALRKEGNRVVGTSSIGLTLSKARGTPELAAAVAGQAQLGLRAVRRRLVAAAVAGQSALRVVLRRVPVAQEIITAVEGASTVALQLRRRRRLGSSRIAGQAGVAAGVHRRRGIVVEVAGRSELIPTTRPNAEVRARGAVVARLSRRRPMRSTVPGSGSVLAVFGGLVQGAAAVAGLGVLFLGLGRRRRARTTVVGTSDLEGTAVARQVTTTSGTSSIALRVGRRRRMRVTVAGEGRVEASSAGYEPPVVESTTFRVRRRVSDLEDSDMAIHQGDVGVVFEGAFVDELGAPISLPAGSQVELRLSDPDGETVVRPGTLAPDVGPHVARYVTQEGDLAKWGVWKRQWWVELPSGQQFSTAIRPLRVEDNLQED